MDMDYSKELERFEKELLHEIRQQKRIELNRGEIILREGAFIKDIPLLLEGSVKVRRSDESGKEIVLYSIEKGESCILSITSCLNDRKSKAEAVTTSNVVLILIPAEKVKAWMDEYKTWRRFVMKLFYVRIDEVLMLVDNIAFKSVDQRLLEFLKKNYENNVDKIFITHQQLANELGTAREVISRLLKNLERQNLVSLKRGSIKILKPL